MKFFRYELEIDGDIGEGRGYFRIKGVVAARNIMGAISKIYKFYTDAENTICSIEVYEDENEPQEISCEQI